MPHSARYNWRTGHPVLDGLLSVWQEYRLQSRPPRWSEIRDQIAPEVDAHLILLQYQGGTHPPVCTWIGPTATQILGLNPQLHRHRMDRRLRPTPHRLADPHDRKAKTRRA